MADDEGGGAPAYGRGSSGGDGGSSSPFLRKLGPLPVWAWMLIALGVAVAVSAWRKNKAASTAAATTAQTNAAAAAGAAQTPPFVIQNYTTTAPGGGPVQQPTGTGGTGSTGGNKAGSSANGEEPYLYGNAQVRYVQQHVGAGGYTQAVYQDVYNAYMQVVHSQGQATADTYHYSWIGPGNVQAIPKGTLSVSQILQNLP